MLICRKIVSNTCLSRLWIAQQVLNKHSFPFPSLLFAAVPTDSLSPCWYQCSSSLLSIWAICWKFPWRRKWQPTPVLLPGKSHGRRSLFRLESMPMSESRVSQRSLLGYSPWCCKESANTFICPPGNPLAIEPLIDITSFLKAVPVSWHKGHWMCGLECQAFSPTLQ